MGPENPADLCPVVEVEAPLWQRAENVPEDGFQLNSEECILSSTRLACGRNGIAEALMAKAVGLGNYQGRSILAQPKEKCYEDGRSLREDAQD